MPKNAGNLIFELHFFLNFLGGASPQTPLCCKNWKIDENVSLGFKNHLEIFLLFDHSLFMDFHLKYVKQ